MDWHDALLAAEKEMVDVIVDQETKSPGCGCYAVHGENQLLDVVECDEHAAESFAPAAVHSTADAASTRAEVKDVPEGNVACDGCRGDGVYYGAGSVVNGVFVGFTGRCYRCGGKGSQTPADVKRCAYYDNRIRRFNIGS